MFGNSCLSFLFSFGRQRYKQGFIVNPLVMSPGMYVRDVLHAKETYGFSGIPVTENGKMGGRLIGLVTQRDIDFLPEGELGKTLGEVLHFPWLLC